MMRSWQKPLLATAIAVACVLVVSTVPSRVDAADPVRDGLTYPVQRRAVGQLVGWQPLLMAAGPQHPQWYYPYRRPRTTVPVPDYRGRLVGTGQRGLAGSGYQRPGSGWMAGRSPCQAIAVAQQRRPEPVPEPGLPPQPAPAVPEPPPPAVAPGGGCPPPEPPDPFAPYGCPPFGQPSWLMLPSPIKECAEVYAFGLIEAFEVPHADGRLAGRFGANIGLPLSGDISRLGAQIGGSASGAEGGSQIFFTAGLFYRGDARLGNAWNVGGVIDWLDGDVLDADLAQIRLKTSLTLDTRSELGLWGATAINHDRDYLDRKVLAVSQINVFYRYLWPTGKDATGWIGWRDDPSTAAIGGDLTMPIDQSWAFTVGGHYGFTGDSWNIYTGLVLYFGGHAYQQFLGQYRSMPYLKVADNTRMTVSHR